jgi:hypothetical protein
MGVSHIAIKRAAMPKGKRGIWAMLPLRAVALAGIPADVELAGIGGVSEDTSRASAIAMARKLVEIASDLVSAMGGGGTWCATASREVQSGHSVSSQIC